VITRHLSPPRAATPLLAQRRSLWTLLVGLVVTLLITLVWLAGRYEASQVQEDVERDSIDAISDVRTMLTRNLQDIQALQAANTSPMGWSSDATELLRAHRELLHIEWRDPALQVLAKAESPFRPMVFGRIGRQSLQSDVTLNCNNARRFGGPSYSTSYFLPQEDGIGQEVIDLCLPLMSGAKISGYVLASYSLITILSDTVSPQLTRGHEVSFTETDGTRLAMHGSLRRGARTFTAQQVLTLPGNTLLLRLVSWRAGPDLFPNVLTALVTLLSVALLSVLALLGRDIRRRLQAERNLADALAFRKAMEDSLVTGLLARDMQGRIRYANPAFCAMVGFSAEELLQAQPQSERGHPAGPVADPLSTALPFWPADMVRLHGFKQAHRMQAQPQAREGLETIFMRKDGTRFPVLVFDAPLIDALGVQTGWMSAFVDISEQRRIEELSRASQERLQASARLATVGEMASLMSHELNQPLAAISSYATGSLNLLQETGISPDANGLTEADLKGAFQRIAEQAERAGKVIKSVHNFVRRREGERASVPPQALLDAIMPLVSLQAQKLQVQVHTHVDDPLPALVCDRTMLEQVLLNLARNGMQAMSGTDIPLRVLRFGITHDHTQAQLRFTVSDQGQGISPDVAKQLFTPFFTTKAEGMGLGLSLCRTVVEQHGGKLEFENGLTQGTIFTFTLPTR